LLNILLVIIV